MDELSEIKDAEGNLILLRRRNITYNTIRKMVKTFTNTLTRSPMCHICSCIELFSLCTHHLIPLSKGGKDDNTNLVTLCSNCHQQLHSGLIGLNIKGDRGESGVLFTHLFLPTDFEELKKIDRLMMPSNEEFIEDNIDEWSEMYCKVYKKRLDMNNEILKK